MSAHYQYFITGTDTEIGKTLVTSAMLYAFKQAGVKAAGMKPIAAGAELINGVLHQEDVERLRAESSYQIPPELTVPYPLLEACAPHVAAQLEGTTIDLAYVRECYDRVKQGAEAVVVEGVGGFRVPLTAPYDTADMAQRLQLPIVLVVGLRLGCLNHALLTAEAIEARGLTLAGWVANVVDPHMRHLQANVEALTEYLPAPLLGCIPRLGDATAEEAAKHLDFSKLENWPRVAGQTSSSIVHTHS